MGRENRMGATKINAVLCACFFILSACAPAGPPVVDWENKYGPALKEVIDTADRLNDCAGLQREFDNMYARNMDILAKHGSGSGDILKYLMYVMKESGCTY